MTILIRMKTIMTTAMLLAVACGVDDEGAVASSHQPLGNPAPTVASPPRSSRPPVPVSDPEELEAQARERTAFDENIAARGEATAIPVPPELERQLEADYQAASQGRDAQNATPAPTDPPVDFDALFEEIRNTMPPQREALLARYLEAAKQVEDPAERDALIKRLASPELDNVPPDSE